MAEWHFITNHGAVFVLIAQQHQITAREIAGYGLTERPVRRIIAELEARQDTCRRSGWDG